MDVITSILQDIALPPMVRVRQKFPDGRIEDVAGETRRELNRPAIADTVRPGMRIAITCGSRGVDNTALVIKTIAAFCRERGAEPFIVPAMGSHGGATAEGQVEVCHSLGVTEEYCGCPIVSSMETVQIGNTVSDEALFDGLAVYLDRYAFEADGIVALNRIKPHTSFVGKYESGLMKMLTIGLGKQRGAESAHEIGTRHMAKIVEAYGKVIMEKANILFGVGLVENAFDQTARIAALTAREILEKEPELLAEAKENMPRLIPGSADVLVVDYIGKNISGDGMDPHITGKFGPNFLACGGIPNFTAQRVVVLDLTEETQGQCQGIDAAYAISQKAMDKMNLPLTYPNAITSCSPCAVPMVMKNDRETVQCAVKTCVRTDRRNPRIIRIADTLHISEILVSLPMLAEVEEHPDLEVVGEPQEWVFDGDGNLW